MVKYCRNCGHELDDGSIFCSECGYNFKEDKPSSNEQVNSRSGIGNPFQNYKIDMISGEEVIRNSEINVGCLYPPLLLIAVGFVWGILIVISAMIYGYLDLGLFVMSFLNIFVILGIIWLIVRYVGYINNDLILTNKRVFGKCGLISTTQMQSPLNKIDSVSFSNGFFGKLLGYGTVEISTTSSHYKFRYITEGQTFYNDIFNQLEISDREKRSEDAKAIAEAIKNN